MGFGKEFLTKSVEKFKIKNSWRTQELSFFFEFPSQKCSTENMSEFIVR